jgi:hypothetical protein
MGAFVPVPETVLWTTPLPFIRNARAWSSVRCATSTDLHPGPYVSFNSSGSVLSLESDRLGPFSRNRLYPPTTIEMSEPGSGFGGSSLKSPGSIVCAAVHCAKSINADSHAGAYVGCLGCLCPPNPSKVRRPNPIAGATLKLTVVGRLRRSPKSIPRPPVCFS